MSLAVSCEISISTTLVHHIPLRAILILYFYTTLGVPRCFFPAVYGNKFLYGFLQASCLLMFVSPLDTWEVVGSNRCRKSLASSKSPETSLNYTYVLPLPSASFTIHYSLINQCYILCTIGNVVK